MIPDAIDLWFGAAMQLDLVTVAVAQPQQQTMLDVDDTIDRDVQDGPCRRRVANPHLNVSFR